mmetsp:Transcript_58548/g.96960  ORF Transcript_58548/g.96960 Transcript_58548/m.96960 type:complete len:201 (+) Transcript_58548:557-1159(+)
MTGAGSLCFCAYSISKDFAAFSVSLSAAVVLPICISETCSMIFILATNFLYASLRALRFDGPFPHSDCSLMLTLAVKRFFSSCSWPLRCKRVSASMCCQRQPLRVQPFALAKSQQISQPWFSVTTSTGLGKCFFWQYSIATTLVFRKRKLRHLLPERTLFGANPSFESSSGLAGSDFFNVRNSNMTDLICFSSSSTRWYT